MQRVTLGRTKLNVSVFGLGAGGDSRLGTKTGDLAQSVRIVRSALERGVDFIDTAEAYGTEEVVGRGIAGWPRDKLVISTKLSTFAHDRAQPIQLSRDHVVKSLEASLRRLGTDYVDIYHLHGVRPESYTQLRDEVVPVLLDLKKQGKFRFLGLTEAFNADPAHRTLDLALRDDLFDVIMVGFNILNQSARESVFPRTLKQDVGTLIMFAVRRAFSRPDRLRELLQDLAKAGKIPSDLVETGLSFLARDADYTSLPDVAYRFVRDEPGAHVVLSGTGNEAHLVENLASLDKSGLDRTTRARLVELFRHVDDVSGQ
ncbi:MAG: aldo/keto reductase [Polyangiales bacterium]